MANKFDGDIGRMVGRHRKYAKYGRTSRAKRLRLKSRLEGSTNAVMVGCRHGVDQVPGLATNPSTAAIMDESVKWMSEGSAPTVPLSGLTQRVSQQYRAQIPAGDVLSRKQKKAMKKELHDGLLSYADALIRLEQGNGHSHLGSRIK